MTAQPNKSTLTSYPALNLAEPGPAGPSLSAAGGVRGPVPAGRLGAVLFDMDGTLVDTEPTWRRAIIELSARLGGEISPRALDAALGTTTHESVQIIAADLGLGYVDATSAGEWLELRARDLLTGELTWRPGARELLAEVRAAGIRTALVTATAGRVVDVMMGGLGRSNFDTVVTDDDVRHGKPDPEPYVKAAAALGFAPSDCVAIEDSPTGAASARDAGCAVLAVPSLLDLSGVPGVTLARTLASIDVAALRAMIVVPAGA